MKRINKKYVPLMIIIFLFIGFVNAQNGAFLIEKTPQFTLWWSIATYKANKAEIPSVSKDIAIRSAKNEYESFHLVIHPESKMENFRIKVSSLSGEDNSIDGTNIWRKEEMRLLL